MKITTTFLLLTMLSIFSSIAQEINTAKLDSFFTILGQKNKNMGSFALTKNGKVVYQKVLGYQALAPDSILATTQTRYRIGSITKVFTATLIFQQIDEGKLSLGTKLAQYFPQLPNADKITIADLLSHTSGLMDYVNDAGDRSWITRPHPKAELLDTIAKGKTHFLPGAKQQYCNSGYLLLGYILEEVTGKPYSKLLASRIVNKLGLKNTSSGEANEQGKNEAKPYTSGEQWTPLKDIYFPNVIGVGDILTTPAELLIFMDALTSGKLMSAASYTQMTTFSNQNPIARGLVRVPFNGQAGLGHTGGTYGTFSLVYTFKESGVAVAAFSNGLKFAENDIAIALLSAGNNVPFTLPVVNLPVLKNVPLDAFLGTYATTVIPMKIAVTKNGDTLIAQATGQGPLTLEAIATNKFKFDPAGIVLEFNAEKQEMILLQSGAKIIFTKETK
jgi:D-alanyl-D-alanine carboxypeptidase